MRIEPSSSHGSALRPVRERIAQVTCFCFALMAEIDTPLFYEYLSNFLGLR